MNTKIMAAYSIALSMGLMTLSSNAQATNYYKWVDAKGTTHYSKTPPPRGAKQSKTVDTWGWNNSAPTPARALDEPQQPQTVPAQQNAPNNSQPAQQQSQSTAESTKPAT